MDSFSKQDFIPNPNDVAAYIDSLQTTLKDGLIMDNQVAEIIKSLPSPSKVKNGLTIDEIKIVFESVRWAWKIITGNDIIDTSKIIQKREKLFGNYWMLNRGLLLHGNNHFTIIKQNINIFQSLLNINAFVLHEKLSGNPIKAIKTVIDYGGCRMFVNDTGSAFFQLNDKSYANWGKNKINELDFKKKTVKLIDKNINYTGWDDGITIFI